MLGPNCLLLDDVDDALAKMTEVGRAVAAPAALAVREKVMDYATRSKWTVIPHREFVDWTRQLASATDAPWLVLDAVFPTVAFGPLMTPLRVTRSADLREYEISPFEARYTNGSIANAVGVIDDAVATGGTLRAVSRSIESCGGRPFLFALCASTREGRDRLLASYRGIIWKALVKGDWRISHLRDGCPHLPFSGRRTSKPLVRGSDGQPVEAREPVFVAVNNLWRVLYMDAGVKGAIVHARSEVAARLSEFLGRPALVEDLVLLGTAVPALVMPDQFAGPRTELTALIG